MNFSLVVSLAFLASLIFGVASILAPEQTASLYGIAGWNPGTLFSARLVGVVFLLLAAALAGVRSSTDSVLQARFAKYSAVANLVAVIVVMHATLIGSGNAMMWSSVALFAFFTLAFGYIGFRR